MKLEKDKKHKNELMATITIQFPIYYTNKEGEKTDEVPHELIVAGCIEQLANKNYSEDYDDVWNEM